MTEFILASSSPRRVELLAQIGIAPDKIIPAAVDESKKASETIKQYALRMAEEKAAQIAQKHKKAFVLGADTVVACGLRVLAKARDAEEARHHLELLSGRRHQVYGAVCLMGAGGKIMRRKYVKSVVKFKRLSAEEINEYLASQEWEGKAGAYAIQGMAAKFITYIGGSYSNVVGLPLFETACLLKDLTQDQDS